jgi:hypothetical protein
MIAACLCAAFFILLPLGVFGFELLRFSIAQLQLRSVCDAAALSGAAAIASTQKGWTPKQAQEEAMKAAFITFKQNSVYAVPFSPGGTNPHYNDGDPKTAKPGPGHAEVFFTLLDQNFTKVDVGDPAAKLIRCEAFYGYEPPIGKALGFRNIGLAAFSESGLPQLDIVLCFDISGSMDDQTPVSFVKRSWDHTNNVVKYEVVSVNRSTVSGIPVSCIFNVQGPPKSGTRVNALGPQNLAFADYSKSLGYTNGNTYAYQFDKNLRALLSGPTEVGAPPGNRFDPAMATGGATTFTDLVVNLDGKDVFAGWTDPVSGLNYPNVGALVEASRGNLDTATAFDMASPGHTTSIPGVSADSRYKSCYWTQAGNMSEPMLTAKLAANNFFHTMNISANCHFGFCAFSDGIGTDPSSIWGTQPSTTKKIIDDTYGAGGEGKFPLPVVKLVKDPATTNFDDVKLAVTGLVSTGKTDIASSLGEAIAQLTKSNGLTRDKARRAIVLFTDGIPNLPGGEVGDENSPAAKAAYSMADSAASGNIPIYCIGLSQNSSIAGVQTKILKKISDKTKAQYYTVSKKDDLDAAFQKIAKSLVVLR